MWESAGVGTLPFFSVLHASGHVAKFLTLTQAPLGSVTRFIDQLPLEDTFCLRISNAALVLPTLVNSLLRYGFLDNLNRILARPDAQPVWTTALLAVIAAAAHATLRVIRSNLPALADDVVAEALCAVLHSCDRVAEIGTLFGARSDCHLCIVGLLEVHDTESRAIDVAAFVLETCRQSSRGSCGCVAPYWSRAGDGGRGSWGG